MKECIAYTSDLDIVEPDSFLSRAAYDFDDDAELVQVFLGLYHGRSTHTKRAYRRECIKLVAWLHWKGAAGAPNKTLVSLRPAIAQSYLRFLADPDLEALPSPLSRLFEAPLSAPSINQARSILRKLFETIRNVESASGKAAAQINPFTLTPVAQDDRDEVERVLRQEELGSVLEYIENMAAATLREQAHKERARWIFHLLYYSFIRRQEAAALSMDDFRREPDGWWIRIKGKGGKRRTIMAPPELVDALERYRLFHGLPALPRGDECLPAIFPVVGDRASGVTSQIIYLVCKEVFHRCALTNPRIRVASPHWMRHTGVTHALDANTPARYVQHQAGHSSLNVTARYDHADRRAWRNAFRMR